MSIAPHTTYAHAKVNLSLRVLAREASGYHQIETIFCALELADELAIIPGGDEVTLEVLSPPEAGAPPPDIGPMEKNLAWRAAAAFAVRAGIDRGMHIRLTKRIPHGAGLGGGSSDAAAVLRALDVMHDAPLSRDALMRIGAELGSDIPFFLTGAALALAWGRGTRIAPMHALPSLPVVLVQPDERIPTGDAYAALSHARGREFSAPPSVLDLRIGGWHDVARVAANDFEEIVFQRVPVLADIRQVLEDSGALIARMTGTGSVAYGVFESMDAAWKAAERVRQLEPAADVIVTATLASMTTPEGPALLRE